MDMPCSHTRALSAETMAAPFSEYILVAHCESTNTALFLVAATFCSDVIMACSACNRRVDVFGPVELAMAMLEQV